MRLIGTKALGVILELDATDCCQLADAIGFALRRDIKGNHPHLEAMEAALRLGSIVAAFDTAKDSEVPYDELLPHARKVWGPVDTHTPGTPRVIQEPR